MTREVEFVESFAADETRAVNGAANLLVFFEKQDVVAKCCETPCRHRAGRPGANHYDVAHSTPRESAITLGVYLTELRDDR